MELSNANGGCGFKRKQRIIDAVAKRMASGREDTILDSIRGESSGIGFAMSKKF